MLFSTWFPTLLCVSCVLPLHLHCDDSYSSLKTLLESKLGKDVYNPQIRPLLNQTDVVTVSVTFTLMSIVEVNDANQRFTVNGLLAMFWTDKLLRWNASDFGGVKYIAPHPKSIWRPRMFMTNTLDERDPFKDRPSELYVNDTGLVSWFPGSLLTTNCNLDVTKYPFDQQVCYLEFCTMSYQTDQVVCTPLLETVILYFFTENESWELTSTRLNVSNVPVDKRTKSCPQFEFTIKRRSMFFVVNVVLPIILLSFLNSFVFLIPVQSGEKISFGITILLALSLFLSTISAMIPKSATNTPHITVYVFSQLVSSVIVVITTIVTVVLHHLTESREEHLKSQTKYSKLASKLKDVLSITTVNNNGPGHDNEEPKDDMAPINTKRSEIPTNKYRAISEHIDKVCFVLSMASWISFTTYFFTSSLH